MFQDSLNREPLVGLAPGDLAEGFATTNDWRDFYLCRLGICGTAQQVRHR
jgi:hypothetical protein